MSMIHKLKNKTRRDGLTFMVLAFMGALVYGRCAFTDFTQISLTAPLEKVVFDFALLGAMYSFVAVPIAVAAFFGWMLLSRPNG